VKPHFSIQRATLLACLLAMAPLGLTGPSEAQQPTKPRTVPHAAQVAPPAPAAPAAGAPPPASPPPQPGWAARCTSASREAPLECVMEQNLVLTMNKTNQLLVVVAIRVPSNTHTPEALIQLPLGLNLPLGAKLQVDEGKTVDVQIQTCENRGCYASTPIAPDLLAALKSGKQLKIAVQNMGKENLIIPVPLGDFAAAYDKIK
jgi:invasion protein IalB